MRLRRFAPLALVLLALLSCGGETVRPQSEDEIALFGFLYIGEAINDSNPIWISRVSPVDRPYSKGRSALTGATVLLRRFDPGRPGGERTDTLRMGKAGYYRNPEVVIEPNVRYDITVLLQEKILLTAATTTPTPFVATRVPRVLPEVMRHAVMADSFPITVVCPDPDQIFLVDVYCTEEWADARYITPFREDSPQSYEEYGSAAGEPRHISAFFRVKNLPRSPEGYRVHFYDAMMAFYGEYDVQVLSIDENYYDFLYRDRPERSSGIEGGIGVFASADRERFRVEVVE